MAMPTYTEEAKAGEKLCPHFQVDIDTEVNDGLHQSRVRQFSRCWGAKCMAWRFGATHVNGRDGNMVYSDDTHGYCGLSGVPGR